MTNPTSRFVYVTYIRTTPELLWAALTDAERNKLYWLGAWQRSDWTEGADWAIVRGNGELADSGQILEIEKPRRIVIRWLNHMRPELEAEGFARCVIEIEQVEGAVKLTVDHSIEVADSQLIQAVSGGWPKILSNLKSLLETGEVLLS
ncbi:MAG: SRPBCC family protein [Novosphingobium sp.]|nr:SRPBCC family protein [Novosphingobium sp.]MBO9603473.1 SRPBCC family protein [Novosphingobium sp.]